jgi:hypothetical protein
MGAAPVRVTGTATALATARDTVPVPAPVTVPAMALVMGALMVPVMAEIRGIYLSGLIDRLHTKRWDFKKEY